MAFGVEAICASPPPEDMSVYLSPLAPPSAAGGSDLLSTLALLRVYLLRLVFSVFDYSADPRRFRSSTYDPNPNPHAHVHASSSSARPAQQQDILAMFRKVFDPDWFLCILEKVADVATKASCLRLLALVIQRDPVFQRQFCEKGGCKMLRLFLTFEPQVLSVMLPLLGLLFRIPVQILPFRFGPCRICALIWLQNLS